MIDVIYGRVVGRNECGTNPKTNCTTPAVCEISKESNGYYSTSYLYPNDPNSLNIKDPCNRKKKYIIVKYSCGRWNDKKFGKCLRNAEQNYTNVLLLLSSYSPSTITTTILVKFLHIADKHAPVRQRRVKCE